MNKKNKHTTTTVPSPLDRVKETIQLKVCGMKYPENIKSVASLQPDYLGFIFYEKSARNFNDEIPEISKSIKKVGVFVDAELSFVTEKIKTHDLQAVQLHGHESPEYCKHLNSEDVEIIKVFSIKNRFNFDTLKPYEKVCDYYLFDTKGELPGGNGYAFNWNVLKKYPSTKPYFLSGGIGLDDVDNIKAFIESDPSKYCYVIDVNSKFEIEPGLKNIEFLKAFKKNVTTRK